MVLGNTLIRRVSLYLFLCCVALSNSSADKVRVFLGYDERLTEGYRVCAHTIRKHATPDLELEIQPLRLSELAERGQFQRDRLPGQMTDFSISRFIVPHLSNHAGWSLFADGTDMIFREDIAKLWALRDDQYAVMVVQHPDSIFHDEHSFGGATLAPYPMFNWSSVMLFNNEKCAALTQNYVQTAPYHDLHQFKWLENESLIGALPSEWNHLVGYNAPRDDAAIVHFTNGVPYEIGGKFARQEYAGEWFQAYQDMTGARHVEDLSAS